MASRMDRAVRGWGSKRGGPKDITHRKEDRHRGQENDGQMVGLHRNEKVGKDRP